MQRTGFEQDKIAGVKSEDSFLKADRDREIKINLCCGNDQKYIGT